MIALHACFLYPFLVLAHGRCNVVERWLNPLLDKLAEGTDAVFLIGMTLLRYRFQTFARGRSIPVPLWLRE